MLIMGMVLLVAVPLGRGLLVRLEASTEVGRVPPELTEVYQYADGIEVRVAEIWVGSRFDVPVVDFTVELHNGSAHTVTILLRGDLRSGPYRRPAARYLLPPGPDDIGSVQTIAIGATSDPYQMRYLLPRSHRGDLVLTVSIDAGQHEPAEFAGGV